MITVKINVTKILKEHLFEGKNGKYLDIALLDNKDGKDQYGNDGFVTQSVSKEARERGERGPIIGNWKRMEQKPKPAPLAPLAPSTSKPAPVEDDDIPF